MSIFGKLDAASIPTNAFFVEKGEYEGEVTDAKYHTNRNEVRQMVIQYTIQDTTSEYDGSKVTQYFDLVDPDMTQELFETLPPDEKKKIRMSLAQLKKTLCGNDGNSSHKGLGVPADDLNDPNWNPEVLKGTKVKFAVSNYGDSGVNVRWVNLQD